MRVILQVTSGPFEGRQIPVQAGEVARFGRSDLADVCFPTDAEMSDVHFELECRSDQCVLRDVDGSSGTLLNNEPISEAAIRDGDLITAGLTALLTSIKGQVSDDPVDAAGAGSVAEETKAPTAAELCTLTELEEESLQLFRPQHTPEQFVLVLTENKQFADAIRILSLHLPKAHAIGWAHHCVSQFYHRQFDGQEQAALDAARQWLDDPTEENRRKAMAAAETSEFRSAASWVALSVFWNGGSLAPEGLPDVPPEPVLCAQGVTAALLMTATQGDPALCNDRFDQMLQAGCKILKEGIPTTVA